MEKNNSNPNELRTPFEAAAVLINSLSKFASIIFSLAIFGYLIGWLVSYYYYIELGTEWLLPEMSISELLAKSSFIIYGIVSFGFATFSDRQDKTKETEKAVKNIRISIYFFVFLLIISFIGEKVFYDFYYQILVYIIVIIIYCYCGFAILTLINELRDRRFKFNDFHLSLVFFIIFWGIYFSSRTTGTANAINDLNPKTTTLPRVIYNDGNKKKYLRLLLINDDKFYCVQIKGKNKYPPVFVVKEEQIERIIKTE